MANPFSHLDDVKLMKLYVEGEERAFEVIYQRYNKYVYSYLGKRVFDQSALQDLYQEVFIKFHSSKELYNPKHPLIKWVYVISKSILLDHLKKRKPHFVELEDQHIEVEQLQRVKGLDLDAQKELSEKEREAIKLRYLSEEEFIEISKQLQTTEANSRKLVSRGLKKLRKKFDGGVNG
jgi:RNA polymerase sigma-70 factor (ECF subfamily)